MTVTSVNPRAGSACAGVLSGRSVPLEEDDLIGLHLAVLVQDSGERASDCAYLTAVLGESLGWDKDQSCVRLPGSAVLTVERYEVLDVGGHQSAPGGCRVSENLVVRQ